MPATQHQLRINESLVAADLDNETVLLNVESGIYFGLDEVGSEIWAQIVAGAGQDEIVVHLLERYEVEPDHLRSDVSAFIDSLKARGILLLADA